MTIRHRLAASVVLLLVSASGGAAQRAVASESTTATARTQASTAGGIITSVAGTGIRGYSGDGGPATAATLSFPAGATQAADGSVLIADLGNDVIRRLAPDGTITTVAGIAGPGGFGGDGGPATSAHLNQPDGVTSTSDGGFLIADRSNNRVRKVSAGGVIVTVAGSGARCANPVGTCGDGGPAAAAYLNGPDRIAVTADGGFLVTESLGNKVRKVSATGVISRVAGTGAACPATTSTCGDGGAATAAQLNGPGGLAVTADGGWVVTDTNDNRVRKVSATGSISTIAGNGIAGSFGDGIVAMTANLNHPSGVAVAPNGAIVIADSDSHLIRAVTAGVIRTIAGTADTSCPVATNPCGDGGPARAAQLNLPLDAGVNTDGEVIVADQLDHRVRRIDARLGGTPTVAEQNHRLVDGAGRAVQLRGVNRAAFESRCTWDTTGVADGPVDQASIGALLGWKINAVRLPLNEDCWLGINGLPRSGTAAGYRAEVGAYVNLLRSNGLYVVASVHMSAAGTQPSTAIDYMPDASHMPTLWASLAGTFKSDHGIIFDPINEAAMASWNNPHPSPAGQWNCWVNGCTLDSIYAGAPRYAAAGLQTLVNAIRGTGATQPVILGGLDYNADLSQLLSHLPSDPQHQLVASTHVYDFAQGSGIDAIFTSQLEPISKQIPVILGELGERLCDSGTGAYTSHVLSLLDGEAAKGNLFGVLGWTWNAKTTTSTGWQCPTGPFGQGGPLLIRNYNGTPTVMGNVLRNWYTTKSP